MNFTSCDLQLREYDKKDDYLNAIELHLHVCFKFRYRIVSISNDTINPNV